MSSATVTVLQALQQGEVSGGHHTGVIWGVQLLEGKISQWSVGLGSGGASPYLVPIRTFTGGKMINRNTDGVGAAFFKPGTGVPAHSISTLLN